MEFVLKRLFAAIHRTSHASALKATARTLLALSVALAMSRPLLTPDSLSGDVGVWLPITVFKFAAVLNRCILASLVVVLVLLLVFSRAGTRRLGLGATGRGLVGQAGLWVGVGAGLAVTEYALNPMWMYVEADPAEVLEVAVFGVLLGGALGILVGLSYERV